MIKNRIIPAMTQNRKTKIYTAILKTFYRPNAPVFFEGWAVLGKSSSLRLSFRQDFHSTGYQLVQYRKQDQFQPI